MNKSRLKIPPASVACAITILFLSATAILRSHSIDPHVTMERGRSKAVEGSDHMKRALIATTMEGEVAHTAERLAEASAVAIAASLYAATEQVKDRAPRTVQELLAGVVKNKLLPPGLSLTQSDGMLISSHGTLIIHYRPSPLGIEVAALGRDRGEGPAIIVRVPNDAGSTGAAVFTSTSLGDVNLPPPFSPAAVVIDMGWSPEQLRSLK